MYLIVKKGKKNKFKIVKKYKDKVFDIDEDIEVYCGKKNANKGKKVARKLAGSADLEILVNE